MTRSGAYSRCCRMLYRGAGGGQSLCVISLRMAAALRLPCWQGACWQGGSCRKRSTHH